MARIKIAQGTGRSRSKLNNQQVDRERRRQAQMTEEQRRKRLAGSSPPPGNRSILDRLSNVGNDISSAVGGARRKSTARSGGRPGNRSVQGKVTGGGGKKRVEQQLGPATTSRGPRTGKPKTGRSLGPGTTPTRFNDGMKRAVRPRRKKPNARTVRNSGR